MNGEYFCVLCRYGSELQRKILRYSDKGAAKITVSFHARGANENSRKFYQLESKHFSEIVKLSADCLAYLCFANKTAPCVNVREI